MTTPSAQLAPVTGTDWPWLQSAVQMARHCCPGWPSGPGATGNVWTATPRVATRKPEPAPRSIGPSRSFALRTMQRWGEADRADDVAAVVSELLANALRHALPSAYQAGGSAPAWPIRLGLLHAGPYVVCAVADPSTEAPAPRQPEQLEECGRGLMVVASLSDQWAYCTAPAARGKVVWAAFGATAAGD
jgi:anti-sigma regulatory factor (Ser/Thr protein kinase)